MTNSYSDGNLVPQGNWTQTGTIATSPIQVTSGIVALGTSGQDIYKALSGSVTHTDGNAIYSGFDINVSAAQATGDYFFHLSDPVGSTNFYERVFAKSSGAGFLLGLVDTGGTGSTPTYGTTVLTLGVTYRVAVSWNFVPGTVNDTFSLYVDPLDTSIEINNTAYLTHTWTSTAAEPAQLTAANLRQGTSTNAPTLQFDNLSIGTTFADAFAIPEPSTYALLAVGCAGLLAIRRRK